jgi:hypothetical protein
MEFINKNDGDKYQTRIIVVHAQLNLVAIGVFQ